MKIIDKKAFAKAALDENIEASVVHVTFLSLTKFSISIYPTRETQIVLLLAKKIKIPTKSLDFLNVFSEKKASELPELTKLNQYAIKLQDGKQQFYRPIYSLGPVELKTLKTYIKTNLANGFI